MDVVPSPPSEITTELRLGLPGDFQDKSGQEKKRLLWETVDGDDKASKQQVEGWPPVCSYRKRDVKVSMDGVIYLRKIELGAQGGYTELAMAIEKLFGCAGMGSGLMGEMNDSSESESSRLIYQDKDGDWMLVGDVPWKMFLGSCKRLRVTNRSDVNHTDLSTPRHRSCSSGGDL